LKIVVGATGVKSSKAFSRDVRRSLLFALSRFGTRVQSVRVRLSQVANPLGGVETCCRMDARLRSWGVVRVEVLDGKTALYRATARLSEHVRRALLDGSDEETPTRALAPRIPRASSVVARGGSLRDRRKAVAVKRRNGSA
jgi:hypothetical protein